MVSKMNVWRCSVCGYMHSGNNPPEECPQCSSKEFIPNTEYRKLEYDGKKFDVLLINGSSHHGHNTSILVDLAEEELKKKKVNYRRFDLNRLNINHCWCCYSMKESACTFPCRDQLDDMPALHNMIINSKAVIVASPVNWNNMSARLKDFLDRLTCIQNRCLLGKPSLTAGKVCGILVNGHEDGAMKTSMDIFFYFQQLGYILAPFSFGYKTHGSQYDTKEDNEFFKSNEKLKKNVLGVVNNVLQTLKLDSEKKLKDKLSYVCE